MQSLKKLTKVSFDLNGVNIHFHCTNNVTIDGLRHILHKLFNTEPHKLFIEHNPDLGDQISHYRILDMDYHEQKITIQISESEAEECIRCHNKKILYSIENCHHNDICYDCIKNMSECPTCKNQVFVSLPLYDTNDENYTINYC